MKNKILIALLFLCGSSTSLLAQQTRPFYFDISYAGSFYGFSNLNSLNKQLKAINYPVIQNYFPAVSVGFSLADTSGKLIEYFEFGGVVATTYHSTNNVDVSFTSLQLMDILNFNIKHKATMKRKYLTGPLIGFGFTDASVTLTDKSKLPQTFDSSLVSLKGQNNIRSNFTILLNLGWSVQKSISKHNNWWLGLRAGYNAALNRPKWQLNYTNITDSPRTDLSGFYASLQLTFRLVNHPI